MEVRRVGSEGGDYRDGAAREVIPKLKNSHSLKSISLQIYHNDNKYFCVFLLPLLPKLIIF